LLLGLPSTAGADYLPGAKMVSISPERGEQADARTQAVDISLDGRYVVFQTQARNLFPLDYQDPDTEYRNGGIFRRDLETGALEPVAYGDVLAKGTNSLIRRGAQNPSIDSDGRHVSFATADQLVATDVNTRIDVYVRDMAEPMDSPAAFALVSARDGSDQPATYGGSGVTGAQTPVESALSADGRRVLFGTAAVSDLPAADSPSTSNGQLFVRDLDAKSTTLVTRNAVDGTPAGGAGASPAAALSADGSTVAWNGQNAAAQTRMQPGEITSNYYYLWRRIDDGPGAVTRRITGAADVDDPACLPEDQWVNNETQTGPCFGPLGLPEDTPLGSLSGQVPALSADGLHVAFAAAPSIRGVPAGNQLDVFLTDMTTGVTRKAGTTELTRELQSGVTGAIQPVKLSADGRRIAFVSNRFTFGVPNIRLVTPAPSIEKPELYVLDLSRMELERVSLAWNGEEIDGAVGNSAGHVALTQDGGRIAFVSGASNHFNGDANNADDAFVAFEATGERGVTGPQEPPFDDFTPREDTDQSSAPRLPVSLSRGPGGSVRVKVKAPQPGTLTLTARARVRAGRKNALRPIAKIRKRVRRAGLVTVVLKPARRYRRYLRRERRLRARLEIRFSPKSVGAALVARRTVSFTT
jgi:Tol biopolymer transport system component